MAQADDIKGRIKEVAGDLTDDGKLKREGQTDQAAGRAKDAIDDVRETAEGVVDAVKDKVHDVTRRASSRT